MRFHALLTLLRAAGRRLCTGRNYVTLMGTLAGIYVLTFCHVFLATYGLAMAAVTAVVLAGGLGLELGWKPAKPGRDQSASLRRHGLLHLAMAVWVFALPTVMQFSLTIAGKIPLEVMAAPGRALLFQCLVAAVILAPAVLWAAMLPGNLLQIVREPKPSKVAATSKPTAVPAPHFAMAAENLPVAVSASSSHTVKSARNGAVVSQTGIVAVPEYDPWKILGVRRLQAAWKNWRANRPHRSFDATVLCRYLFGMAIGLLLDIFLIAPAMGVHGAALSAAAISAAVFLGAIVVANRLPFRSNESATEQTVTTDAANTHFPRSNRQRFNTNATAWGAVFVIGGIATILSQMVNQLAAAAAYLVYIQWTAVLLGLAFGLRRGLQPRKNAQLSGFNVGIAVTISAAALTVLLFGKLIDLSLWMNAFVVDPWMMMASRGLLLVTVMMPVGYGWGRIAAASSTADNRNITFPALQAFAFTAGLLLSRWVLTTRWEISGVLVGFLWVMIALAFVRWFAISRSATKSSGLTEVPIRRWRSRLARGAVLTVIIAATMLHRQYDPVRSARQLFATNVFIARMNGLDKSMLSYLDEARPVAAIDGHYGTLTLWRYRGTQLQLRENGVPKSIVSTDPNLCPHFSAEVMPAVLPLVLHEDPNRVLVLGLSGGVPLTTTLAFPIEQVTCVEGNPQLLRAVRDHVWAESQENPDRDNRLSIVELEPAVAVACGGASYDVIISTPDKSALLNATPYFTRGFYNRIAERLSTDGIFCQRFNQIDYGPSPLQTVVKSLQSEFKQVVAIEIAAGEMALLATNSDRGLSRGKLVKRFQAPHVQNVLARIGWDWAFPLNLTAFGNDGLKQFTEATPTKTNTAANGAFAFGLPQEVMRWAPKWQELLTLLAPHGTRLLEAKGVEGNDPVLLRRLGELAGQHKLKADYPDQWWAYRKAVKRQLREQPRTLIAPGEDGLGKQIHPEDRHRMSYLKDLAAAAKEPSIDNILRVAEYREPYDPMISYFVHHEVASLYSRSKEEDPRAELWYRLHVVYYAGPHERSVRDVASAMTLLAEHPEAVDRPSQRWDHLNAMMQILKTRWETRGLVQPRSAQIVLNDIEECLTAVEKSFDAMAGLHDSVGITADQWEARRHVVERGLIHPLRAYRSQLLKHHLAERQQIKALLKQLEEGIEDPEPAKSKKGHKDPSPTPAGGVRPVTN